MKLTPELAPEILAACQDGAAEASGALSRALDGAITLTPGDVGTARAANLVGSGLVVVFSLGTEAAVFAIPETSGLLPAWYAKPDATGLSKLATLAQELGMLLLPETCMPDDFAAFRVDDLAAALKRDGLSATTPAIALPLTAGPKSGMAWLIWPLTTATAVAAPPAAPTPVAPAAAPAAAPRRPQLPAQTLDEALPAMPNYTRSLLRIRVPVVVTLAKSHQPLSRIVELAPGSIIPFAKSCDDTLTLEVNNREVAVGEAVKVGDKFGLRITSMTLPPERFVPLKSHR